MSPSLIIDCSLTMAWCFADEATEHTANVQDRLVSEAAIVPAIWFLEVANVLTMAEKRRRITVADATEFVQLLSGLDIQTDAESTNRVFNHVLPLARSHQLTAYDATYLDLALRTRLPLASLDDELRAVAARLGIELLGK